MKILLLFLVFVSSSAALHADVLGINSLDLLPRQALHKKSMGINAFSGDPRFGRPRRQLRQATKGLGIRHLRLLFVWSDAVQPGPNAPIDFSFYDEIASSIPRGVRATVVLYGLPDWMQDQSNWINGDPRQTFVEKWVGPVAQRYRRTRNIRAWQIWNEPNTSSVHWNVALDLTESPKNYVDMLAGAYEKIKSTSPRKRVVMAATTAINQNFPSTLDYNKALKNEGAELYSDIWALHVYGSRLETFLLPGGIIDFMKNIDKPVWVTESGERGVTNQLNYVEKMWPFLRKRIPSIKRIFYYNFAEGVDPSETYSLRTLDSEQRTSDLYRYLRQSRRAELRRGS